MRATAYAALILPLALAACWEGAANTTVSGTVEKGTRITPSGRSLLQFFESPRYSWTIKGDDGATWSPGLPAHRIDWEDARRILEERVTFRCYRGDPKSTSCVAQSIQFGGRELVKR